MHKLVYRSIFIVIAAIFLVGLTDLFSLRFQQGDVYPAYSSLRSDPLGTKVLFKSLENFRVLSVRRNYQPFASLEGDPGSILLYLGAGGEDFKLREKGFYQSLDQYVIQGGRLVISFLPSDVRVHHQQETLPEKREKKPGASSPDEDEKNKDLVSMEKRWGLSLAYEDSNPGKDGELAVKKAPPVQGPPDILQEGLPPTMVWHSTAFFHCLNDSWHTLYTFNGKPVMIEKALGRGSIVLMTDSFYFSNEALLKDRQLSFLNALFQGRKEIVFDEYHLGVVSQHGIIDLMVKYRLQFFLWTLFCIFLLLIWKNSSLSSRGVKNNAAVQLIESRKDYFEGLTSLLRKNLAVKDILNVCVEQWYQDAGHTSHRSFRGRKIDQELKSYIEGVLTSLKDRRIDAVRGYQLIYKKLTERKRYE